MKKHLICLLATLAFTATFAAYIAPIRTLVVPQATATMTMDATDDETSYSAVQSMDAFNPTGSTGADADFTSTFKVCFDRNYLYFFGKILDEYNNSTLTWDAANQWTYDNFEVFMDLDTNGSGSTATYDTNTVQIRFNRGYDSVRDCGRAGVQDYIYSHDSELPDGWQVEVAIPWKFVLGSGQVTEDIMDYLCLASGFDVSAADSDTDGADARDCQTAWDNDEPQDAADRTEDNAWNNRTVFGIVTIGFQCGDAVYDFRGLNKIDLYPNPAGNLLTINNIQNNTELEIIDMLGQSVLITSDLKTGKNDIDISSLPNGNMYFIRITDQNGIISSGKFVKE